jgi:hypothetical protein
MAKILNISLSDEQYERLQAHKSKFNVSKTCAKAIMRKVEMYEVAESGSLLDFLRAGKMEAHCDLTDQGRKYAREMAENNEIDYSAFRIIHRLYKDAERAGNLAMIDGNRFTESLVHGYRHICEKTAEHIDLLTDYDETYDGTEYLIGFCKEIYDMWEELKNSI